LRVSRWQRPAPGSSPAVYRVRRVRPNPAVHRTAARAARFGR
jgi:hypothetical protein